MTLAIAGTGLTRTEKHMYSWDGGPLVPGVTSIKDMLDKSGPLIGWAKRETAASAIRNLPMLATMRETGGEKAAIDWLKAIPDFQRDTAADLGSRVHVLAEALARRQKIEVSEDEAPLVNGYMRWAAARKPEYKAAEYMVFSERHQYGGTADAVIVLDGETWLVDYKTGKGVYAETALQLAGLNGADFAGKPGDPKRYAIPKVDRFGILHVRPELYQEGARLIEFSIGEQEWLAFLACRALHRWVNERSASVKGVAT